jgi:hypothetical protein
VKKPHDLKAPGFPVQPTALTKTTVGPSGFCHPSTSPRESIVAAWQAGSASPVGCFVLKVAFQSA